jgi:regulatory protein
MTFDRDSTDSDPSVAHGRADGEEPPADPVEVARIICLRQLTAAPKTRSQLAKKRVPQEAAQVVLDRLTEVGLIDDAAFAQTWVESRRRDRGLSRRVLAHELRQRGVAVDDAKPALDFVDEESDERTARALVEKKVGATGGLAPTVRTRRLIGLLARKGYSPQLASRVVREVLEADGEAASEDET